MKVSKVIYSAKEKCLLFKEQGTDVGVGFWTKPHEVEDDLKTFFPKVSNDYGYASYSYKERVKDADDWVRLSIKGP